MEIKKVEKAPTHIQNIVISGIVAGIAICIGAIIVVAPVFANEIDIVMKNLNLPDLGSLAAIYFFGLSFVFGIIIMLFYVILKPYFRSKITTAVTASLIIWGLAYFLNNVTLVIYGFLPVKLAAFVIGWGFIDLVLAGIIGSILYEWRQKS